MSDEQRDTVLFTVSAEVAQAAIAQVSWFEACNFEGAKVLFEWLLDDVMQFSGVHTDYVMERPPACPRCGATANEKTLVEWDGSVEIYM